MTDKKTETADQIRQNDSLTENLTKRIRNKIPDGIDFASIGSIDLSEAEKIATEEIVFLTEDDLIEGLEDFELIPLKSHESDTAEKDSREKNLSTGLRIKTISAADNEAKLSDDLSRNVNGKSSADNNVEEKVPAVIEEKIVIADINDELPQADYGTSSSHETDLQEKVPVLDDAAKEENIPEETVSEKNIETDIIMEPAEAAGQMSVYTADENKDEVIPDSNLIESGRITEDSVNIQLEDIFTEIDAPEETLPQRFKFPHSGDRAVFIDEPRFANSTTGVEISYHGDPLTDRLSRVIHASDASLSVITEKSDYFDELTYFIEDMSFYQKSEISTAESDEIFYGDPDLDFFENAIIKNDFSRFIQEIDDYYDIAKIESESQISEILGLNSEERELIEKDLFSGYYGRIDIESEIDFLNPDLDFINRVFVQNKNVSYIIDNPDSLFDDEKISIEDDITSGSAIVFEEDVEDLKELMKRDYGHSDIVEQSADSLLQEVQEIPSEIEVIEKVIPTEKEPDIINITDRVIILEDKKEITAFTRKFPGKEEDLVKLFSYLDGLFEKLPEETVKRFAESEYFDLYVKVMNEIGA